MGTVRNNGSRECDLVVGDIVMFMPSDTESRWGKLRANKAIVESIDKEDDDYEIYIDNKNVRLSAERVELIFIEGSD